MHSKDSTERTSGPVNHPDQAEWMAFLYGEIPSKTKRDLQAHLKACPECAAQVQSWRASMKALDSWKLPRLRPAIAFNFTPIIKWAAAAAAILLMGFLLGRRGLVSASEVAELKASVAQLNLLVQNQTVSASNSIAAATTAANDETLRLLTDYSRSLEEQRAADRQSVSFALHALTFRVNHLDSDLETVAVNTENGFEQTHENITRVASLSLAPQN
jgi:anti-sigma factor RsiW